MITSEIPVAPTTCISLDEEKYTIEIELPGVNKEDINLEVAKEALYLTMPKYGAEFTATLNLDHSVKPGEIEAKFENGLLKVTAPLVEPLSRRKIEIE